MPDWFTQTLTKKFVPIKLSRDCLEYVDCRLVLQLTQIPSIPIITYWFNSLNSTLVSLNSTLVSINTYILKKSAGLQSAFVAHCLEWGLMGDLFLFNLMPKLFI